MFLPVATVSPVLFASFRWFEKTAVREGLVYGLLNRRCLFVWNADTSACLNKVELTDSVPGDAEPAVNFTFVSVGQGLVATIHRNLSAVTLLTEDGGAEAAVLEVPAQQQKSSMSMLPDKGPALKVGFLKMGSDEKLFTISSF